METNKQIQKTGAAQFAAVLKADSVQEQFQNALGEHKDAFVASLIDLYNGDKALQGCKPNALVCEALRAATLKLPLNKALGFAYIVAYNTNVKQPDGTWKKEKTPSFLLGYKGYIQLAMRTGQYRTINADVVYEGELGEVDKLTGDIRFNGQRKSDKVVGYFCHFELLNGFAKTLYMTVEDMAKYAKRFSAGIGRDTTVETLVKMANQPEDGKGVGWTSNFTSMALKTVIRRLLSKYGYLSVEMQGAMAAETENTQAGDIMPEQKGRIEETADYEEITAQGTSPEAAMQPLQSAGDEPQENEMPEY